MHKPDRIGVVLEAFLDQPLDEVLTWLSTEVPDVTAVEVGAGGYAPHPHCEPDELLAQRAGPDAVAGPPASPRHRTRCAQRVGQPAASRCRDRGGSRHRPAARHPARGRPGHGHDRRDGRCAGSPRGRPGTRSSAPAAGSRTSKGCTSSSGLTGSLRTGQSSPSSRPRVNPELRLCIELHPGTAVYNVETFEKFAALGPNLYANLDPSHFFWMGMDAIKVVERILPRIGHVHAKDTTFNPERLALERAARPPLAGEPRRDALELLRSRTRPRRAVLARADWCVGGLTRHDDLDRTRRPVRRTRDRCAGGCSAHPPRTRCNSNGHDPRTRGNLRLTTKQGERNP